MCGRYTLFASPQSLEQRFGAKLPPEGILPRYNAAPTQLLPVILNDGTGEIRYLSWGLVPSWAKDPSIASKLINARAETLLEKPSFRNALKKRRCLVLTDGFYEWAKSERGKYPVRVCLGNHQPYAMAGLWEQWLNPANGELLETFVIITVQANERIASIHERMPAFLRPQDEAVWLDNNCTTDEWLALLRPYPEDLIEVNRVSMLVNSNRNDDPRLLVPEPDEEGSGITPPNSSKSAKRRKQRSNAEDELRLF